MALQFLGKDPDSPNGDSATVWEDTETSEYVLQGYVVADPAALGVGPVPDGETVIRFPKRMMRFFPEVNGGGRADA